MTLTTAGSASSVTSRPAPSSRSQRTDGAVDDDALEPGCDRPPERMRDADPDLVVPAVGGLVAEEDEVERPALRLVGADRRDDRRGDALRIPLVLAGDEVDRAIDAERHRLAQLLDRLRRPEAQRDGLAAVRLDEPHGLLHAALLVRADGEAEVLRVERLRVVGEQDAPAGQRHALDADEELHARILAFSGSKIGARACDRHGDREELGHVLDRELGRALDRVLGRQVREQDVLADRRACAGARDVRAAALASVSGVPSRSVIGSRPSG